MSSGRLLGFAAAMVLAMGLIQAFAQDQASGASPNSSSQQDLPRRVRVSSGVMSGLLLHKVNPTYPPEAKEKGIQGVVKLAARISKEGDVEELSPISGDPTLAAAAIEAAKQWKYRPFLLQGQPVEVETEIQINFTLART